MKDNYFSRNVIMTNTKIVTRIFVCGFLSFARIESAQSAIDS